MNDLVRVERISPFSGKKNVMYFKTSQEKVENWIKNWPNVPYVQDEFPELNADEREFLRSGITPEEWDNTIEEIKNK